MRRPLMIACLATLVAAAPAAHAAGTPIIQVQRETGTGGELFVMPSGHGSIGTGAVIEVAGKPADDPSFRLINRSRQPIVELFATPAGMTNWGENRLNGHELDAGTERLIRIPRTGNCIFDLRVVFADHKALEKRHDDLCRITDLPVP